MEFHAAKCPNCGGSLQLPNNLKTAKCMYCGVDVIVKDAIGAVGANVENWLKLASTAAAANNHQEAYDYFTKVLEYEPQNHVALLGKAEAAGRLSTPLNFRGKELTGGIKEAVDNAPDDKKEEIKQQAAEILNKVCSTYSYSLIDHDPDEAAMQRVGVMDCLEFAHTYAPTNTHIIRSLLLEFTVAESFWQAARTKANHTEMQISGRTDNALPSFYDEEIARYRNKKDEYLSKLQIIAPEVAADFIENERKLQEENRSINTGGCLTTISLIILSVTVILAISSV